MTYLENDKRLEYRIPANLYIHHLDYWPEMMEKPQATIRELSASGCRLQSSVDLGLGQEFEISFNLNHHHRLNRVKVKVIRRLSHRTRKAVAVEFVSLSEKDRYRIREYIVWKEAKGE